ncbi:hypothetical protein EB796_017078 [Bugula neritina]|uniref:Uncharacterized protein n=1 Tax=Bugula neritina TaxID=10212 RepID=A0A7J7JG72_BUGNE|nr:hypothetical protein EB796_017078 [Bugula neritina]
MAQAQTEKKVVIVGDSLVRRLAHHIKHIDGKQWSWYQPVHLHGVGGARVRNCPLPTNHPHICVVVCGGNDIGKGQCPAQLAEALVNRVESRAEVVVFCGVPLRKQTEKGFKIPANFW